MMADITVGAGLRACPQIVVQDSGPRATTEGCPYNYFKICNKYTFVSLEQPIQLGSQFYQNICIDS